MPEIDSIKKMDRDGKNVMEIAKATGHSRNTVRKYIDAADMSPQPPVIVRRGSCLDDYKDIVLAWLEEDKTRPRKQRHTAMRIWERLRDEHGFTGGYQVVQRFMKAYKAEHRRGQDSKQFSDLDWPAGTAQADFGHALFVVNGLEKLLAYLCLVFPYSNMTFLQVFPGETAECVCQGLWNIFTHLGGVAPVIIFDNATGIGRRNGEEVTEAELFTAFRVHCGFEARYCNPYSGHEKGSVEAQVGCKRRQMFVPPRVLTDFETENAKLLVDVMERNDRVHYRKERPQLELFEDDKRKFLPLPTHVFEAVTWMKRRADKYGKVQADGKHFYLAGPEHGSESLIVGLGALDVKILTEDGTYVTEYPRMYGSKRTDSGHASLMTGVLASHPGSWMQSPARNSFPDQLRDLLDKMDIQKRKSSLKLLDELTAFYGFEPACQTLDILAPSGTLKNAEAHVLAQRIVGYGLDTPPEPGPSLSVYDCMYPEKGGAPC